MHVIHGGWLGNNGDRYCDPRVGARLHAASNGKFASSLLGTVGGRKRKHSVFFHQIVAWDVGAHPRPSATSHCPRDRASPTTWH